MKMKVLKLDATMDRFEVKRILGELDMFEFNFQVNKKNLAAESMVVVKLDGPEDDVDEVIEILAEENVKFVELPTLVLSL